MTPKDAHKRGAAPPVGFVVLKVGAVAAASDAFAATADELAGSKRVVTGVF